MVQFMPFLHILQYGHTVTWITYVHSTVRVNIGKKFITQCIL